MQRDAACSVILAAYEGLSLDPAEENFFRSYSPAGVTLFSRNIPTTFAHLKQALRQLQDLAGADPFLVAVDQEGGRVARLTSPFPDLGPAMSVKPPEHLSLKSVSREQYLNNYGFTVGAVLRALGVNVNFAPVCDVLSNPNNVAIGDRCFADNPQDVSFFAGAFMDGLHESGVSSCLKHFPGQGDASADTHLSDTQIKLSLEELEHRELVPFCNLLHKAPMVMMSHAVYPAFDDKPASLSQRWMVDYLRRKMGFEGVVVSDDMNMKAIPQDDVSWQEAIVEAIVSGCDLVLVCRYVERCQLAIEGIRNAMSKSSAVTRRIEDAAQRVLGLRKSLSR